MKLPFVWMFHKGERPGWGQMVGRDRSPRHLFPDALARSLRREGSNHGACPASSRSLLPAGQLKRSATHPCRDAHELRAASLHVVLRIETGSCCHVCSDPDNSASTELACAAIAPSLCRSSCRFSHVRIRAPLGVRFPACRAGRAGPPAERKLRDEIPEPAEALTGVSASSTRSWSVLRLDHRAAVMPLGLPSARNRRGGDPPARRITPRRRHGRSWPKRQQPAPTARPWPEQLPRSLTSRWVPTAAHRGRSCRTSSGAGP